MKLRIRGNSIRFGVSKTELAMLADLGTLEDSIRFSSTLELKYAIELRPAAAVTVAFDGTSIRAIVPRSRFDLWLRPDEVSVEGSQPIGGGKVLQIVLEKDFVRGRDEDSTIV